MEGFAQENVLTSLLLSLSHVSFCMRETLLYCGVYDHPDPALIGRNNAKVGGASTHFTSTVMSSARSLDVKCFQCQADKQLRDVKRCGSCRSALYCVRPIDSLLRSGKNGVNVPEQDSACQKMHWPNHKRFCHPVEGNWSDKYRGESFAIPTRPC